LLREAGRHVAAVFSPRAVLVISDEQVAARYLGAVTASLQGAGFSVSTALVPPGEQSKSKDRLFDLYEACFAARLERRSLIVALGGGVVGDLAGYVAASYLRGIPFVQMPTTLLAQVDSSVGGKTGINLPGGKNLVGAFHQPSLVLSDVAALATLDDRQYRAGLVESVKHAAIADAEYFDYLEKNIEPLLSCDTAVLEHIASENCRIKAAVVAEDPTEQNKRRILNYGHTLGHAVETASAFSLLHGEAVAAGMIAAGMLEDAMGLVKDERLSRLRRLLEQLGQPTRIPKAISKAALIDLLKRDKKAVGQWPRFVLLEQLGRTLCKESQWAHEVAPEAVETVIEALV